MEEYEELEAKKEAWTQHRESCEECKKALRGKLFNETLQNMYSKCCKVGKQLYRDYTNFLQSIEYIKKDQ